MFLKRIYYKIKNHFRKSKLKKCGVNVSFGKDVGLRGHSFISVGDNVSISSGCKLHTWKYYKNIDTGYIPNLEIDNDVTITNNSYISCVNSVIIGSGCLLGENCFITDNFHGNNFFDEMKIPPNDRKLFSKGPVHIGKNVWLGRNVCVMPNVTIGDYAVIGANSVVTHDIPAYAIAAGCPAKVIKTIN